MIVVCARESPRSAIISTRSRKLSLERRYQRTQRTIISRSKWRPLKSSSMLSTRQLCRSNNQPASYAALTQFAPEPLGSLLHLESAVPPGSERSQPHTSPDLPNRPLLSFCLYRCSQEPGLREDMSPARESGAGQARLRDRAFE